MSWLSSGPRSTLHRSAGRDPQQAVLQKTALIRKAMLECLDGDASQHARVVARKIHLASDAERLWHLRGEIMTALALNQGEALAQQKVASFNPLFRDILPHRLALQLFGVLQHPLQRGDPA